MMHVLPSYWLSADVRGQHIQLRVSESDLSAILSVLRFNHATSVSYAAEPKPEINGTTINWPYSLTASNV